MGGGLLEEEGSLYKHSFEWMVREAHDNGLLVDENALLVIVFPLLIWFPLLRQPSWAVGTAAGVVLAWFPLIYGRLHDGLWDRWQALVFTTLAGASWGGCLRPLREVNTRRALYRSV